MQRRRLSSKDPKAVFEDEMERAIYLEELASLSRLEYERQRDAAAAKLGIRKSVLDKLIHDQRKTIAEHEKQQQQPRFLDPVTPWAEPVAGADLMKELTGRILPNVSYQSMLMSRSLFG
jgi:predicted DNA-binding protein (UPF0251 family)